MGWGGNLVVVSFSFEGKPYTKLAWEAAGEAPAAVTIRGQSYNKLDCLLEALKLNAAAADTWYDLGTCIEAKS